MVANRYLQLKINLGIRNPLPVGFFQDRLNGDEDWIQFKYERLFDFCYKCGSISHVTEKCQFGVQGIVTTNNGITAKLYGPWLRAEENGSLCFINLPEESEDDQRSIILRDNFSSKVLDIFPKSFPPNESPRQLEQMATQKTEKNALEMCLALDSLFLTLEKKDLGFIEELQKAVEEQVRYTNFDCQQLASWAENFIQAISISKAH